MKVLLITFSDNADHQDITFGLFESLYKKKISDCDAWVMGIKTPKVGILDTPHTKLVDCPPRPGIVKKTFDLKELFSIVRWINKQKFDVIFFETLHVWNIAIMLLCHKKAKIFQMIHDVIPHNGDKQAKSVSMMNKVVCKLADKIVLANKKYVKELTELFGANPSKVRCIDMWRRFPEYVEPAYSKRVLFFGRMNPYKGIDNLLEIAKKCPEVQFDAVGRVDSLVKDLVDQLEKLPNVEVFDQYVTNDIMERYFSNADWIILPYNSATQSGVVIDGYRYGRPCIAFNVGAIAEQVVDGETGFLINPGDNIAFSEKLNEAVQMDSESFYELSKKAYDYGVNKYAADGAVERFINLIKKD